MAGRQILLPGIHTYVRVTLYLTGRAAAVCPAAVLPTDWPCVWLIVRVVLRRAG